MLFGRALFIVVAGLIGGGFASAAGASLLVDGFSTEEIDLFPQAGQTFAQCGSNCTQSVDVTSSTGSALNFVAAVSTTSGGNWLSVSPSGPYTTEKIITVNANPAGLQAGNYTGTITLTCNNGSTCTGATITVVLNVSGIVLTAAPNPVNVTLLAGQQTTTNVVLTGSANINVSVTSGGTFLSAPTTVSSPTSTFTLTIDATHLSAGGYQGSLQLQCASGGSPCVPVTLAVSLTVTSPVSLNAGALSNSLSGKAGQTLVQCGATCTATFTLSASSGSLNYSIAPSSTGNWLGVSPTSGTVTTSGSTITVTANPASLTANSYSGSLTISCVTPSSCTAIQVNVSFTVNVVQTLNAGALSNSLSGGAGQSLAQCGSGCTATFTLSANSGSLNYQIVPSSTGNWLGAAPLTGTATTGGTTITVTANPSTLNPGPYSGMLTISCTTPSSCSPITVNISFTVTGTTLTVAPNPANITVTAGQSTSMTVTLSGLTGSTTAAAQVQTGGTWLTASVLSQTSLKLTVNAASLSPGNLMGSVQLQCQGGSACLPAIEGVNLTVSAATPKPTLVPSLSSVSFSSFTGRGDPAAQILSVSASDGSAQPFTVSGVPAWLTVSPLAGTTGQASGTLTLTPSTSGVPPAGASGMLTLTPGNGATPTNVGVSISFSAFTVSPNPTPLTISVPSGGTQTGSLSIGTADTLPATVTLSVTGSNAVTVPGGALTVPGNVTVTANASGLQAGANPKATITITCASANPCSDVTVPVQLTVTAGSSPSIKQNGIVPLFSSSTTVQQGEWISIFGDNLGTGTFNWNGDYPQSLGGTSVKIDGKPGYLSYVSSTQINVQVPDDSATGTVPVVVTTPNGTNTSSVTLGQFGPALSLLGDARHAAGIIYRTDGSGTYGGGVYDIIGPNGTSLGYKTVAAKAGDYLELFGVGFGATTPAVPAGQPFTGAATTNNKVTLMINNVAMTLQFQGLSGAGLYQFNFVLPAGLGTGDVPVQAMVGGVPTQTNVVVALQ